MKAKPECFPRAAKDREPEAQRRGAERLNFCYATFSARNFSDSSINLQRHQEGLEAEPILQNRLDE
jgi:hypothetical protein